MMMNDPYSRLIIQAALNHTTVSDNTVTNGAIIDTSKYDGLVFAVQSGDLADASATFTFAILEGEASDLSDAAAAAAIDVHGSCVFTQAEDNTVKKIGYKGKRRYVRLQLTPSGNASDAAFSALAILSGCVKLT